MNTDTIKVKKGGLDTIIAFIVVLLPLVYILIFMVATLYHFTVQMYVNQVVKETLVMASTYGTITKGGSGTNTMEGYLLSKLQSVENCPWTVKFYVKKFDNNSGIFDTSRQLNSGEVLEKADILGIYVESDNDSLLSKVSSFNLFDESTTSSNLKYSAYREEIIRNEYTP